MFCLLSLPCSAVLDTVIEELKNILKRDFNKRMIEATAFKTFEAWWDDQDRKFKVRMPGNTHLVVDFIF